MDASVLRCDDHTIRLQGLVTAENVTSIRKAGEKLIAERDGVIRVDLSALENAQSVVLSLLLSWKRFAQARQTVLDVHSMPERLQEMASVSGLDFLQQEVAAHS